MKKQPSKSSSEESFSDLYLFFGDEFLVKEQVRQLVNGLLEADLRETNLVVIDGNNLDIGVLSNHLFTPSLFGGPRVILVDQTSIFMGRSDQKKLATKTLESWRSGDRKAAFRNLSQLLSVAGLEASQAAEDPDWTKEVLGESASADEREAIQAVLGSFLDEGRSVRTAGDEEAVAEIVSSRFPEGTVLIFTSPAVDKRKKVFKAVEKRGKVVEFAAREEKYGPGLDKDFFEGRVRDALAKSGKKISGDALHKMHSRSGKELRRLHGELEKLVAYVGDREQITVRDVEEVFSDFHEAAFYDLTNAIRTADLKKCMPALHDNLKMVDHPLQTLGAIAGEIRRLMAARELLFTKLRASWKPGMSYDRFRPVVQKVRQGEPAAAGKSKFNLLTMKDYPLYLLLRDAQKFQLEKLARIMEAILEADIMMKSSRVGYYAPGAILENLILTICSPAEKPVRRRADPHGD